MRLRLSLLDLLILSELVPLFLVFVIIFTTIILVATSANLVNYLTQGIPLKIVVELIWFNILPWLVPTFPMAMLISSTIAFVRLSTQSEIVALFAAGVPFRRLLVPIGAFSLLITLLALYTNDTIAPYAQTEFDVIKADAFHLVNASEKPFDLPPLYESGKLTTLVHVEGGVDTHQNMINVYLTRIDPLTGVPNFVIHAREARWQGGQNWQLEDGTVLSKGMYGDFGPVTVKIDQTPDDIAALAADPSTETFRQLFRTISRLKSSTIAGDAKARTTDEVILWDKVSLPAACIVFVMIGAPLGLRPQRSAALGVAISLGILIILVYYALYEFMQVLGGSGNVAPLFAAFVPDLLGAVVGIALISRSSS